MKTLVSLIGLLFLVVGVQAQRQRLTVLWMYSPADRDMFEDLLIAVENQFESAEPDIDVQFTLVDWADGQQTIKQQVSRGTPPDMAVIGARWVPEFVSLGIIEPLDRYMNAQFRGQFISTLINEGSVYQGRVFGLPIATSTRALFYNRDLFEQAGIADPPETWSDLRAAAEAITALPGDVSGFGLQGGGGLETNTYFYYFVWGNNGDIYDRTRSASALNSPEAVEALTFVRGLIDDGLTQPNVTDAAYERRRGVEDLFVSGQVGMVISGPWFINRLRTEAPDLHFGVAPLPYNTRPSTYGVIDAITILRTSPNKELAWQFLRFLYEPERRLQYALRVGVLPELRAVAADPAFAQDPDYSIFLDLLADARFEPLHIQSESIALLVIDALKQVYTGSAEPQAALEAASTAIDTLLGASVAGW